MTSTLAAPFSSTALKNREACLRPLGTSEGSLR